MAVPFFSSSVGGKGGSGGGGGCGGDDILIMSATSTDAFGGKTAHISASVSASEASSVEIMTDATFISPDGSGATLLTS